MLELVEANFRSLAWVMDQTLDPGLVEVSLDHSGSLVLDTGGG